MMHKSNFDLPGGHQGMVGHAHFARSARPLIVSAVGVCLSNLCPTRPVVTASSPARYNPAQIIPSGTEKLLRPFGQQSSSPAKKKFLSQPNRCPTRHNWLRPPSGVGTSNGFHA